MFHTSRSECFYLHKILSSLLNHTTSEKIQTFAKTFLHILINFYQKIKILKNKSYLKIMAYEVDTIYDTFCIQICYARLTKYNFYG